MIDLEAIRADLERWKEEPPPRLGSFNWLLVLERADTLLSEVERWRGISDDLFAQSCGGRRDDEGYSHDFISAYEDAQCALIDAGLVPLRKCVYTCCDRHKGAAAVDG